MIYIKFGPGTKLILQGHAGYASPGEDIVCAGVSTLYYTFLASTDARETVMGDIRMLEAEPVYKNRITFNTVKTGLEILAARYPGYVKILNNDYPTATKNNSL